MLLNDNQKKERTEMKKIRKDAKTLGLDFVNGFKGYTHSPIVNMDSIPRNEDGIKALYIELGNGTIITVYDFALSGMVHVDVCEHGLEYMDGLSIDKHQRITRNANKDNEFGVTTLKATGKKVQVEFETFHEPLEK